MLYSLEASKNVSFYFRAGLLQSADDLADLGAVGNYRIRTNAGVVGQSFLLGEFLNHALFHVSQRTDKHDLPLKQLLFRLHRGNLPLKKQVH